MKGERQLRQGKQVRIGEENNISAMLKEFWDQNKHQIQLSGILTGVGALFLSIPLPEQERARAALLNIQFIWLLITTISVTLILIKLAQLSRVFELKNTSREEGIRLEDTISFIVLGMAIHFIINMWTYTFALYREAFFAFISATTGGSIALVSSIGLYLLTRVPPRFKNSRTKSIIAFTVTLLLISIPTGALISLMGARGTFSLRSWLYWSLIYFVILSALVLLKNSKKDKTVINNPPENS